ncbi:MAG: hypothetical protein WCA31_04665 [Acidimicrobiales bacterium]
MESPLTEHERQVLLELEMSLLSGSRGGDAVSAGRVFLRARRFALWSLLALVLGAAVLTSALTESLVIAGVGLAVMAASSLALAHHVQSMIRASRMIRGDRSK